METVGGCGDGPEWPAKSQKNEKRHRLVLFAAPEIKRAMLLKEQKKKNRKSVGLLFGIL